MIFKISQQIFLKLLKYQISWKSAQWELSCSIQTDRHDKANSHFTQFRARAWKTTLMSTWIRHPTACDRLCILISASFPGNLLFFFFPCLSHLCKEGRSVKIFITTLSSSKCKRFGRLVAPAVVWVWTLIPTSRNSCGSPAGGRRGRSGSIIVCSRQRCVLSISPRGKRLTNFYTIYKIHLPLLFAIVFSISSLVYILKIMKLEQRSLSFLVLHKLLMSGKWNNSFFCRFYLFIYFVILQREFSFLIVQMIDVSTGVSHIKTLNWILQPGPPSLHYYYAVVLHFCIVLPPVGHSSNHKYHCC